MTADCGAPPFITRATVSSGITLEGSIRTYTCNANTLTQGTINTRCQLDGKWTAVDLYCRRKYFTGHARFDKVERAHTHKHNRILNVVVLPIYHLTNRIGFLGFLYTVKLFFTD